MIIEIIDAIVSLNPDASVIVYGSRYDDDYPTIEWNENTPEISKSDIDAELLRLDSIEEWHQARRKAYPSLADQADMQYWDSVNGTTTWADAIAAVKAAHPKP